MRRILALLAALSLLAPASAIAAATNDTITITITSVAAGCSSGCTRTLNGPTSVNLLPLIITTYQQPCNTSINGTCTNGQVLTYFMGTVGTNLKKDIQAAQMEAAVAAAQGGITPVPVQ